MIHLDPFVALRLHRGVEQLHRLGPRAAAEFLVKIAGQIGSMPVIMRLLAEYERRPAPVTLNAAGGDTFPARILSAAP